MKGEQYTVRTISKEKSASGWRGCGNFEHNDRKREREQYLYICPCRSDLVFYLFNLFTILILIYMAMKRVVDGLSQLLH